MIDLTGQRFGRLVVLEIAGKDKFNYFLWRCLCDCGNYKNISSCYLRRGNSKSCGCLQKESASKCIKKLQKIRIPWLTISLQEHIWNNIKLAPGDKCWEWQLTKDNYGYG